MKHIVAAILLVISSAGVSAADIIALPETDPKAEIWCVEGWKFLYVEKVSNGTFQFFQITRNGGLAVQVIECDGTEVRIIGDEE